MPVRVLLDESTPRRLATSCPDSFDTRTAQQMGWAGCENGELFRLAADHGFDALVAEVIALLLRDPERRLHHVGPECIAMGRGPRWPCALPMGL